MYPILAGDHALGEYVMAEGEYLVRYQIRVQDGEDIHRTRTQSQRKDQNVESMVAELTFSYLFGTDLLLIGERIYY